MTVNLLELLSGEGDLEWQFLASCKDMPVEMMNAFFEGYEEDPVIAEQIDNLCISCPVAEYCFEYGVQTKSTGTFGGIYLSRGKIDKSRNAHKTAETWKRLDEIHALY